MIQLVKNKTKGSKRFFFFKTVGNLLDKPKDILLPN